MSNLINTYRNFRDRVSASVSIKKRNILFFLALLLIFWLAVFIRLSPILQGDYLIKAFDPWIQYYNAEYLSQHSLFDYFNWKDFKSWYPTGVERSVLRPGLPFTLVSIYELINFLGFPISLYDVAYFFPAFMGGLTVLAMYFLGKEVLDRKCGLFAAFFLALSTGHMQRTVAGFVDNETIGVFATLMTFAFFVKTLKTGRLTHAILGGVFSGYLALSWGGYQFVFFIIPIVCILLIVLNKYNENVLIAYAGIQGTGLILAGLYVRFEFSDIFSSLDVGGLFFLTVILIFYHIIYTKKSSYPKFYNRLMNLIKWGLIPGGIILAIIIWVSPQLIPFGFGSRFQSILNPLFRNQLNLVASVAEHMPSSWSVFYYHTLIPMMLLPLGIYFAFKRYSSADVFLIVFLLTLFYFTGSMIRIILVFSAAAALIASFGLVNILKIFGSYYGKAGAQLSRKRKKLLRRKKTLGNNEIYAVYFLVGFLCISQVVHATDISISQLSYSQITPGGVFHDWEESLVWMKNNLPGDTVVVSWWDYGYWITPIGNMTTVCDNGNLRSSVNGLVGLSFMQTEEIYSAEILRILEADYVLVYFGFLYDGLGGDEGKWQWMLRIANDHYNIYKDKGYEQDNWKENTIFDESEYVNSTDGKYGDKWFNSLLVKMMFYGVPTSDPQDVYPSGSIVQNYITGITNNKDMEGNSWKSHIPENGAYDFKILEPAYFSRNYLVKLFKVDYTPLDSKFIINNADVYDNGYGTFELKNIGTEDLSIEAVEVNHVEYNFSMGNSVEDNILSQGENDIVWIDMERSGVIFNESDTVNIEVSAKSGTYTFTNKTSNFFVRAAQPGQIKILRDQSTIIFDESTSSQDAYISVKNTGTTPLNIDKFYVDDLENEFSSIEYMNGSSILKPGEKSSVYLKDSPVSFLPLGKYNEIGVITVDKITDSTLFSANVRREISSYKLSIIPEDRVSLPELETQINDSVRSFIPQMLNNSFAMINNDTSTSINLMVKNTGNRMFSLYELNLIESTGNLMDSDNYDWKPIDDDYFLSPNEEKLIEIQVEPGILGINDIIGLNVTGYDGTTTTASDIGFFNVLNNTGDIAILETIEDYNTTYIYSNNTAQILIKNIGNEILNFNLTDSIYINNTLAENVSLIYGDTQIDIQDCLVLSFNVNTSILGSLQSGDPLIIRVETNEGISKEYLIEVKNS